MDSKPRSDVYTSAGHDSKEHKTREPSFTKPTSTKLTVKPASWEINYPDPLPGGFQPGKKSYLF